MTLAKAAALKSQWKASMQSIIYRAHQLGKLSDRQYQSLFRQMGYKGYRSCEPVPIVPEEPEMFRELLEFHRERVRLAPDKLAEYIGETRKEAIEQYGNNFSNFRLVG
jgi:Zn-dependent peptidase ImmA (M78 family)